MKEWEDTNDLFKRPQFDSTVGGDIEGSSEDSDHDDSGGDDD